MPRKVPFHEQVDCSETADPAQQAIHAAKQRVRDLAQAVSEAERPCGFLEVGDADFAAVRFSHFADAASLCTRSGFRAALRPMSRILPLFSGFKRLTQTALSLHGAWTRKTRTELTFAAAARMAG
jgi:hypothetical protein